MAYQIEFEEVVLSTLEDLGQANPKILRQVFMKVLSLRRTPSPHDSEKLHNFSYRGFEGYRVTVGEYRIIYAIDHPKRRVMVAKVIQRDRGYREIH